MITKGTGRIGNGVVFSSGPGVNQSLQGHWGGKLFVAADVHRLACAFGRLHLQPSRKHEGVTAEMKLT